MKIKILFTVDQIRPNGRFLIPDLWGINRIEIHSFLIGLIISVDKIRGQVRPNVIPGQDLM
jgi:hypothetical protein